MSGIYIEAECAVCQMLSAQTLYCRQGEIHWAKCSQFQPIKVFMEILSRCLGQKCFLFSVNRDAYIHGKTFVVLLKTMKV